MIFDYDKIQHVAKCIMFKHHYSNFAQQKYPSIYSNIEMDEKGSAKVNILTYFAILEFYYLNIPNVIEWNGNIIISNI